MPALDLRRVHPIAVAIAVILIGLFLLGLATDDRPIMAVAAAGVVLASLGWWLVS